jgi:hypothetical protein
MATSGLFRPGRNIAIKVPPEEFEATVAFYRDTLGLVSLGKDDAGSAMFEFGGKTLWIDNVPAMSQAEVWLEVHTDDINAAAAHLHDAAVVRRDDIEPLPRDMAAFWIRSPAGIIHLVSKE